MLIQITNVKRCNVDQYQKYTLFIIFKLFNIFFSFCLKPFSFHDCLKIICLTRLAYNFAAVSKVHDLITCESNVQVVSLVSYVSLNHDT